MPIPTGLSHCRPLKISWNHRDCDFHQMTSSKRILREYKEIKKSPPEGVTAAPNNPRDLFNWNATLKGPKDSPYEGGTFRLKIYFPQNYPFKPPKVQFDTRIYHPNVNAKGKICIDILRDKAWSPALTIGKVLLSISALLDHPNFDHPLVPDIAKQYKRSKQIFSNKAREWTKKYAST